MITTLQQFAGNERTLSAVQTMLQADRVPQTVMLEGPAGSGRKTLARLMAAGLLCEGETRPCGKCAVCRLVQTGHPDVMEIAPEKDKTAVSVDQIRRVRADAFVRPNQGRCKVYILCGAVRPEAQNAFLKILEEPPAGVYFILLCRHAGDWLETVVSRATLLRLGPVTWQQAQTALPALGLPVDDETRLRLEQSGGLLGELIAPAGKTDPAAAARACAMALAQNDPPAFLVATAGAAGERAQHAPVLEALYALLHGALRHRATQAPASAEETALAKRLSSQQLLAAGQAVQAALDRLPYNPNGTLLFTALCARLFHTQS